MGIVACAPKTSNDVKSITNDADIVVRFLIVGRGSFSADVVTDSTSSTRNSGNLPRSGHSRKAHDQQPRARDERGDENLCRDREPSHAEIADQSHVVPSVLLPWEQDLHRRIYPRS